MLLAVMYSNWEGILLLPGLTKRSGAVPWERRSPANIQTGSMAGMDIRQVRHKLSEHTPYAQSGGSRGEAGDTTPQVAWKVGYCAAWVQGH